MPAAVSFKVKLLHNRPYHDLPVHLPPDYVFFSPAPTEARVKSRPVLPLWMYVKALELFHVFGIPDTWLGRNLGTYQYGDKQSSCKLPRTASRS